MNKSMIVSAENLVKEYKLHGKKNSKIVAVNGVSLKIKKGDRIGIVGANGSGKSTLLKMLAGITKPTKGNLKTFGKVVTLMNLEDGFSLDLTGRENILINGLLVGMNKEKIEVKTQDILSLANIGAFIDEPFFTYSAGMKFRLAFAIAMAAECDLLIVDELLISGDITFQSRVLNVLDEFCLKKKIATIFCSHIPSFIWRFSEEFYQMDGGKLNRISVNDFRNIIKNHEDLWKKNLGIEEIFI